MFIAIAAVFLTGVMLLLGGVMLALRSRQDLPVGIMLAACGAIVLVLACQGLFFFRVLS